MPHADAARLPRLKQVIALKTGRMRSQPWRILWHDTADLSLARDGLVLSEQRDTWRLEALVPDADQRARVWPPGAPPPLLGEAADPAALTAAQPMRAVATCEGTLRSLSLRPITPPSGSIPTGAVLPESVSPESVPPDPSSSDPSSPEPPLPEDAAEAQVTMAVLEAELRTVTLRLPCARVWLEGDEAACAELALALATQVALAVPHASLAGEALAAVTGTAPMPRRLGAPTLPDDQAPAEAFAHAVGHLADVILHWAPAAALGLGTEPVHQMRVALRRLRACLSVFRRAVDSPAVRLVSAEARHLAGLLGPARDWDVFVAETGAAVVDAFTEDKAVARLIAAAERRRKDAYGELRAFLESAAFRCMGIHLAVLAGGVAWQAQLTPEQHEMLSSDLRDFAARVLARRLKRLLQSGEDIAEMEAPLLHRVRLDGKRLRYAAEIFAPLFDRKEVRRFLRRLTVLQERLGTLNDGVVAGALMAELAGARAGAERAFAAGVVRGFVAAKGMAARGDIVRAWQKFCRVEPFW